MPERQTPAQIAESAVQGIQAGGHVTESVLDRVAQAAAESRYGTDYMEEMAAVIEPNMQTSTMPRMPFFEMAKHFDVKQPAKVASDNISA